jgi:hypothetical protein
MTLRFDEWNAVLSHLATKHGTRDLMRVIKLALFDQMAAYLEAGDKIESDMHFFAPLTTSEELAINIIIGG